jgi:hypothetical protein
LKEAAVAVVHPAIYDEFMDFMTSEPSLQAITEYRLSEASESRIGYLLDANRNGTLLPSEREELDDYIRLEHMMRTAKLLALQKLAHR